MTQPQRRSRSLTAHRAQPAGADLTDAFLSRANLTGALLSDVNLTGADLTGANLSYANLTGANFTGREPPRHPRSSMKLEVPTEDGPASRQTR